MEQSFIIWGLYFDFLFFIFSLKWLVVPWFLLFPLIKMGLTFSLFSQWELHWAAMTSQIWWTVAKHCHLPVLSESLDASYQTPWTWAPLSSSDGFELSFLYTGWLFIFLVLVFALCNMRSVAETLISEDRQNSLWIHF